MLLLPYCDYGVMNETETESLLSQSLS